MSKVDRRILKSREAIKKAFIALMSEQSFDNITIQDISNRANVGRGTIYSNYIDKFDLLDKLIGEHINEMRELYESTSDMDEIDAKELWFDYIKSNYVFFSTMLESKGAPYFRNQFLEFLVEEFKDEVDINTGKNQGLNEEVILQIMATSYYGVVEWWVKNEMPYPPYVMAEHVGVLLEGNL
ncbi:TetR/AcrR family transcriptional regulator [Lederbergia citrea]|uniref:TetR/AcrR family transcriptional regulator n=1 Tax=Lederbergia citrea TaxID=2833581 RepID=A0A942USI3_9BACI|nr:TetR/AcrR family transcriptional regulator [Lederbergia citrea]MBS4178700.1 TetR/AcrR family transcriptional regulator [Lederbergia citrea]MBS4224276.1 TetR/AcrR family transcriptional regulator [Lederbergia citrea]